MFIVTCKTNAAIFGSATGSAPTITMKNPFYDGKTFTQFSE